MALSAVRNRPGTTARRLGYVIAVVVNAGMPPCISFARGLTTTASDREI